MSVSPRGGRSTAPCWTTWRCSCASSITIAASTACQVDTPVEDRPNNTVRIKIDVKEGDRAKIRQVNIVGNESFDEDEIREDFELDTAQLAVVVAPGRSL